MAFNRGDLIKSSGYTKLYSINGNILSNLAETYPAVGEVFIHKKIITIFLGKSRLKEYGWLFDIFYGGRILSIDSKYLKDFKKIR